MMVTGLLAACDPVVAKLLERGLNECLGRPVRVLGLSRKPMDTYSVHPIHRLRVTLSPGEQLDVIFKQLHPDAGKDARREVLLYRELLAGQRFGAPMLYGSLCDDVLSAYWLFLEDVGTWRLDWCGINGWERAFRWLARLHAAYHGRVERLSAYAWLGEHDSAFYHGLASAARKSLRESGGPAALTRFDRLMGQFDSTVAYLVSRPRTLVHGDLSSHNVMVQRGRDIRPLDWEWAAVGLAAWDVEKLLAGWGDEKPRLLAAYLEEFERHTTAPFDREAFNVDLAYCAILRTLWYLRWWIEPCTEATFVDTLLDKMESTWRRLDGERANG